MLQTAIAPSQLILVISSSACFCQTLHTTYPQNAVFQSKRMAILACKKRRNINERGYVSELAPAPNPSISLHWLAVS